MAHRSSRRLRRRRAVSAVTLGALVVGGSLAYVAHRHAATSRSVAGSSGAVSTSARATPATCPLTGLPAPGGAVPQRPALAIKVGNDPGARPQSGLDAADMVYEVQAEGGITRFIAIYQCNAPTLVGPIRSLRWVDWHVLGQFGSPILVYAGGIEPDRVALHEQGWLHPVDALNYTGPPFVRTTTRVPPENLYGSPAGIWALVGRGRAPAPVFAFASAVPRGGQAISAVTIAFSGVEQPTWTWSPTSGVFVRSYAGAPALDASGQPETATNVVIQFVNAVPGSYDESGPNSLGVHSEVIGSGAAWVLRNGELFRVRWSRASLSSPTVLTTTAGTVLPLAPGRSWVEAVPPTGQVTVVPASSSS